MVIRRNIFLTVKYADLYINPNYEAIRLTLLSVRILPKIVVNQPVISDDSLLSFPTHETSTIFQKNN
jgi:hypothetical protein